MSGLFGFDCINDDEHERISTDEAKEFFLERGFKVETPPTLYRDTINSHLLLEGKNKEGENVILCDLGNEDMIDIYPPKIIYNGDFDSIEFEGNAVPNRINIIFGFWEALTVSCAGQIKVISVLSHEKIIPIVTDKADSKAEEIYLWVSESELRNRNFSNLLKKLNTKDKNIFLKVIQFDPSKPLENISAINLGKSETFRIPDFNFEFEEEKLDGITRSHLPSYIYDWMNSSATNLNSPLEMIAAPFLTIIGSIIGMSASIQLKQNDPKYKLTPNIWGLVVAPPSTKKSPSSSVTMDIVNDHEKDLSNKFIQENLKKSAKIMFCEEQIKSLRAKLRDLKLQEGEEVDKVTDMIADHMQTIEKCKFEPPLFSVQSATIEKLMLLQKNNSNGLMLFLDEFKSLFQTFKKNGHENDRTFYLSAWNATKNYKHATVSRGLTIVPKNCVSIFGNIPDSEFQNLLKSYTESGGDGLFARFQVMMLPKMKTPSFNDDYSDPTLSVKATEVIKALMNEKIAYQESDTTKDFKLDKDGSELCARYLTNLWSSPSSTQSPQLECHFGKYDKLLGSLCIILHVLEHGSLSKSPTVISQSVIGQAILWCQLLEKHAIRIYSMKQESSILSACELAKRIVTRKVASNFSPREVYRKGWVALDSQSVKESITFLLKKGWITQSGSNKDSGLMNLRFDVNPIIYKVFGDDQSGDLQ